jgi:integrase
VKLKDVTFPYKHVKGSVSVMIYHTPTRGNDAFTIAYYKDRKRARKLFGSFDAALKEAKHQADLMGSSDARVFTLSAADGASILRSRQILKPWGIAIEVAAAQIASMCKTIKAAGYPPSVTPQQIIEDHVKRRPVHIKPMPVAKVITEMLEAKLNDGLSEGYRNHLKYDLEKFEKHFGGSINTVSGTDVDAWLRKLKVGPRTRNNLRNSIQTLFTFAKARRFVPKDHDEMDSVAMAKVGDGEIEIYTPSEMAEILAQAGDPLIPFLTIGAFAGIRHAEIQRLEWTDINFEKGIIDIKARKAKTASRRIVPLLDNLRAWLEPHRETEGAVCFYSNMASELNRLVGKVNGARRAAWAQAKGIGKEALEAADDRAAERRTADRKKKGKRRVAWGTAVPAGAETAEEEGWKPFDWKHNALRHSFISYRVATVKNIAEVSLEAGNSPQMIFQHYREVVDADEAKKWFAIVPDEDEKVIALTSHVA